MRINGQAINKAPIRGRSYWLFGYLVAICVTYAAPVLRSTLAAIRDRATAAFSRDRATLKDMITRATQKGV